MPPDCIGQRFQKGSRLANPVGQCGPLEIKSVTVEDEALAIERQVIGILADQHVGQQSRARSAAFDWPGWQGRLGKPVAAGTGQPWAHDPVHDKAAGNVFQFLGHILTNPAQGTAAVGAAIAARGELDFHARDVIRDRAPLRLALLVDVGQPQLCGHRGGGDLARFQRQLQLIGRLRGGAEPMRTMAGKLVAQLLDQDRLRLHFGQQARREDPQFFGVFRQRSDLA